MPRTKKNTEPFASIRNTPGVSYSCGRWDLNPHALTDTRSLVLPVCHSSTPAQQMVYYHNVPRHARTFSQKIFSKIKIILRLPHAFSWLHCFFSEHSFSSPLFPRKLCPFPPSFPHRKLYSLPPVLFASSLFYSSSFLFLL